MAAALECWSSGTSTDEDLVEQVVMKTQSRSEAFPSSTAAAASPPSKDPTSSSSSSSSKWQRFSRNVAKAITNLKNSLNLDTARDPTSRIDNCRKLMWGGIVRNLTLLYPGSQLLEKLIANIRMHFDSLPLSCKKLPFFIGK